MNTNTNQNITVHNRPVIGIIGTGWLGKPLAEALIASNYTVKGTTTSPERVDTLQNAAIIPFIISLTEEGPKGEIDEFLSNCTLLIINIPPGLRRDPSSNFEKKIKLLTNHIQRSGIKKLLYISSTSVFSDTETFPTITHTTIPNAPSRAARQLIKTESLLTAIPGCRTTILRFGGLFGANRHPAHMLSKRSSIQNPLAPVNLIHLQDCIQIISKIISTDSWDQTFNAAYPDHPEKQEYYTSICNQLQIPLPQYDLQTPSKGKLISDSTIFSQLHYKFEHDLYKIGNSSK